MKHTYTISGMTCSGCQKKVHDLLAGVNGVQQVVIDLAKGEAMIDMNHHIPKSEFVTALHQYPKYQITASTMHQPVASDIEADTRSWLKTYKPILLIFGYISVATLLVEWNYGNFNWMRWMNHFMAGFFMVFSFFKLLNLKGFAESYAMYDVVSKQWNGWGYLYPFVELLLGFAYLTGLNLLFTNAVTFVVMTISVIGVLQSVLNKRKIKCACLGDVFNLPMSTITIIEDALMIAMSAVMLFNLI